MLQKFIKIKFILAIFAAILPFSFNAFGQASQWLDMKPLPSWNSRKRVILETKKISNAELKRCSVAVRQPTLPQDFLLTSKGWTLVNAAQVFGKTAIITTAEGFDGMCRPLKYETYVFVGNKLSGALTPAPMDSRTDGSVINVQLYTETDLTAEFARYRDSDALCCPYKTEKVTYKVKADGRNFLLVPEFKSGNDSNNTGNGNSQNSATLQDTIWRWQSLRNSNGLTTIKSSGKFTLEFASDGKVSIGTDCNRGGGSYKMSGNNLTFSPIFSTKMACSQGSLEGLYFSNLQTAQSYKIENNSLQIKLANGGTMKFSAPVASGKTDLENTTWRWESSQNLRNKLTIDKPENYQIEFSSNGDLGVKADCNGGGGSYEANDDNLKISSLIRTQIFCGEQSHDTRFVRGLENAQTFKIEGNMLTIKSANDTMKFFKVIRQN
ncbi:MAG: META domain-containing protein [Pyrinomonadaceae bacterium]